MSYQSVNREDGSELLPHLFADLCAIFWSTIFDFSIMAQVFSAYIDNMIVFIYIVLPHSELSTVSAFILRPYNIRLQ